MSCLQVAIAVRRGDRGFTLAATGSREHESGRREKYDGRRDGEARVTFAVGNEGEKRKGPRPGVGPQFSR